MLWIRVGPGAIVLPPEVTKITMEFNRHINGGHRGARKFWREMLPRIKYRNPSLIVQIQRHDNPAGPAKLNIFTSTSTTSDPPAPAHSVDIRMTQESEILAQLVSRTNAIELKPTEEEEAQLLEVADQKARSEADRIMVRDRLVKERREEELLRQARGELAEM